MTVEKLITKASKAKPPFTATQLTELRKILEHNDSVPKTKKVSGEAAAEHFGMSYVSFMRAVKATLGRTFGGSR